MQQNEQTTLKGCLTLQQAVTISGYTPAYLKQLTREGHIGRIEQQGIIYFSAKGLENYIQPRGYLTIEEGVKETGFNARYLRKLAREKHIRSIKKHRRTFLFTRDVKKLIVPEGFVTPEEAADIGGYVAEYLVKLSRQGTIKRAVAHGKIYLSLEDVRKYGRDPEGYFIPEEASSLSGYSAVHLRRLAKRGFIGSTQRHGIIYFSAQDIDELKAPEGFLTLKEAVRRGEFSIAQIKYRIRVNSIRSTKTGIKRYVSAEDLGINLEEQGSNTSSETTLEGIINKS